MLSVDHYELIRRKHVIEGLSIRAICRELGHSRKTIRKVLAHRTPPGYQRRGLSSSPVMDAVSRIVDAWLEQDRHRPPKQRHTAQRIYERLRDDHGFTGNSSAVRRYVSKLKTTGQEVFMPYRYEGEGTKKFINVLLLFTKYDADEVRQAVSRCVQRRAFSDEAVLGVLRNEPIGTTHHRLDLSHLPELMKVGDGIRPAALYDCLLHSQVAEVVA